MSLLGLTCSYYTDWPLTEVVRNFMYELCHRGLSGPCVLVCQSGRFQARDWYHIRYLPGLALGWRLLCIVSAESS